MRGPLTACGDSIAPRITNVAGLVYVLLIQSALGQTQTIDYVCCYPRSTNTGHSAFLESFGRRRRTKVLEERTRGGQASVYGDLGFWLMQDGAG